MKVKQFRRVFIMLTMETLLHNQLFTRSVRKFENRFISIGFNFDWNIIPKIINLK